MYTRFLNIKTRHPLTREGQWISTFAAKVSSQSRRPILRQVLRPTHPCAAVSGEGLTGREGRVRGTNSVIVVGPATPKRSWLEVEIITAILAPTIPDHVIGVFGNDLLLDRRQLSVGVVTDTVIATARLIAVLGFVWPSKDTTRPLAGGRHQGNVALSEDENGR